MKQTNAFIKFMDKLTLIVTRASSALLIFIFLLVTVNVVGRKVFNMPVKGSVELVEYLMLITITFAMARTGFEDRHVAVTIVQELLPQKARYVVKAICELAGGVIFGSLVLKFAKSIPESIAGGRVSDIWHIPYTVVFVFLTAAMAVCALTFFYQTWLCFYKITHAGSGDKSEGSEV